MERVWQGMLRFFLPNISLSIVENTTKCRQPPGRRQAGGQSSAETLMMEIQRTIKYDADRVKGFGREVMSVPGCEQLESCIQCGTCSGVCPLSIYMDYTPRQVMALTRGDFKNEVLKSHTIWLCASCYACTVGMPARDPHHRHHV